MILRRFTITIHTDDRPISRERAQQLQDEMNNHLYPAENAMQRTTQCLNRSSLFHDEEVTITVSDEPDDLDIL